MDVYLNLLQEEDGSEDRQERKSMPEACKHGHMVNERWIENSEPNAAGRRDNKWGARSGFGSREMDRYNNKYPQSDKEATSHNRHSTGFVNGRGDREPDVNYVERAWRPQFLHGRARGGSFSAQSNFRCSGVGPGFSRGRGRALPGTGIIGASICQSHVPNFRYSVGKLLQFFRQQNAKSFSALPDDFCEVPHLTQSEHLEPLSFLTPDVEEQNVLQGIWKGEIVNSGMGNVDGLSSDCECEDSKDKAILSKSFELSKLPISETSKGDKVDIGSQISVEEQALAPAAPRNEESIWAFEQMGCGMQQTELNLYRLATTSTITGHFSNVDNVQMSDIKDVASPLMLEQVDFRESSYTVDQHKEELSTRNVESLAVSDPVYISHHKEELSAPNSTGVPSSVDHIAPEALSLFYVDPRGNIQGPFSESEITQWFQIGYFGTDLPVQLAGTPAGTPFVPLGDVMPQLKHSDEMSVENTKLDEPKSSPSSDNVTFISTGLKSEALAMISATEVLMSNASSVTRQHSQILRTSLSPKADIVDNWAEVYQQGSSFRTPSDAGGHLESLNTSRKAYTDEKANELSELYQLSPGFKAQARGDFHASELHMPFMSSSLQSEVSDRKLSSPPYGLPSFENDSMRGRYSNRPFSHTPFSSSQLPLPPLSSSQPQLPPFSLSQPQLQPQHPSLLQLLPGSNNFPTIPISGSDLQRNFADSYSGYFKQNDKSGQHFDQPKIDFSVNQYFPLQQQTPRLQQPVSTFLQSHLQKKNMPGPFAHFIQPSQTQSSHAYNSVEHHYSTLPPPQLPLVDSLRGQSPNYQQHQQQFPPEFMLEQLNRQQHLLPHHLVDPQLGPRTYMRGFDEKTYLQTMHDVLHSNVQHQLHQTSSDMYNAKQFYQHGSWDMHTRL